MRKYVVDTLTEGRVKYFFIRDCESMDIVLLPSKYLKEIPMEIEQVYKLGFESQNEHFINFLHWLKAGNHTQENKLKTIHNGTCNAYLEDVFRFHLFMESLDEQIGSLKVLSYSYHMAVNAVGVQKKLRYQAFKGYLKAEERDVRPAEHEEIIQILQACTNCRDQLLILMIAETGFRIGEILGVLRLYSSILP